MGEEEKDDEEGVWGGGWFHWRKEEKNGLYRKDDIRV